MSRLAILLLSLGLLFGCSSGNPEAPNANGAHPEGWVLTHGLEASADTGHCAICHGVNFEGHGAAVACSSCHMETPLAGQPFRIHPASWYNDDSGQDNVISLHQQFPENGDNWGSCAIVACHGDKLQGGHGSGQTGPGCFTAKKDATGLVLNSCHDEANGGAKPMPDSHTPEFINTRKHGIQPRQESFRPCFGCHGTPPNLFDGGITARIYGTGKCWDCHLEAQAHPVPWQGVIDGNDATHRLLGPKSIGEGCGLCHATTSAGAGAMNGAPGCFSPDFLDAEGNYAGCHAEGPGPPHALDGSYLEAASHGPAAKADLTFCQVCHAEPGEAGKNPRFNVGIISQGNRGCEACHPANSAHPATSGGRQWYGDPEFSHAAAGNITKACVLCHGAHLQGTAENGVAPACGTCHTVGLPTLLPNCSSCHNAPPDGDVAPNRAGLHAVHLSLSAAAGACTSCHTNSGPGLATHFNNQVEVDMASSFDAKSGRAVFESNGTCSNVSCHGGQNTSGTWMTGASSIDVNNCILCHKPGTAYQTPQYNSYYSGRHKLHMQYTWCTSCHDPAKLTPSHFAGLDTPEFQNPDATLINYLNYNGSTCTTMCHRMVPKSWN